MKWRTTWLLLALVLGQPATATAGPLAALCRFADLVRGRGARFHPSPAQENRLRAWIHGQTPTGHALEVSLTDDELMQAVSDLPADIREMIFAPTFEQTERRFADLFHDLGVSAHAAPAVDAWLTRNRFLHGSESPAEAWAAAKREVAGWDRQRAAAVTADAHLRIAVAEAKRRLMDDRDPHYRIQLDGNQARFPDGVTYPVRRSWTGNRIVMVPYRDLIHRQQYLSSELSGNYASSWFLGWSGFSRGAFAPDGRYILDDAHHHTKAYAMRHTPRGGNYEDTPVPIRLVPAEDGNYYTRTHWAVMADADKQVPLARNSLRWNSDPTWSFLSPAVRDEILRLAPTDPAAAARLVYYDSTGLTRLGNSPAHR